MRIHIFSPAKSSSRAGNTITAARWAQIFRNLNHSLVSAEKCQTLIALNAEKSAGFVADVRRINQTCKVIVAITGTDAYGPSQWSGVALSNLKIADAIVALEPCVIECLPEEARNRTFIIRQSAQPLRSVPRPLKGKFEISVVGHLRKEKDPFLIVEAIGGLPSHSKICVNHIGKALSREMQHRATQFTKSQPRYYWRGEKTHRQSRRLIARSRLAVNTSLMESSANAVVEAIVGQTPVLATKVPGNIGVFGENYPGLFAVGNAKELTELLLAAEKNAAFYRQLQKECQRIAVQFTMEEETAAWQNLLMNL